MRWVLTCGAGAAATSQNKAAMTKTDLISTLPVNVAFEWLACNAQASRKVWVSNIPTGVGEGTNVRFCQCPQWVGSGLKHILAGKPDVAVAEAISDLRALQPRLHQLSAASHSRLRNTPRTAAHND